VPLDGARAEEQLGGDLRVREPLGRQADDLGLLRGELVQRLDEGILVRHAEDAAATHERLAFARADGAHQQIERRTLALPAEEPRARDRESPWALPP
jgi:hypothetical protein